VSLRSKILLILIGVVLVYATADHLSMRHMVGESFDELEEVEAEKDLQRVVAGLEVQQEELLVLCRALAGMPATRAFLQGRSPDFVEQHLGPDVLESVGVDLLFLCDAEGRVVWGRIADPETREPVRVRQFPGDALSDHHPARHWSGDGLDHGGLMATDQGVVMVGSRRVPAPDGGAGLAGNVIAARFVDRGRIESVVAEQTGVRFALFGEEFDDSQANREIRERMDPQGSPLIESGAEDVLRIHRKLPDLWERPSILLTVERARDITAHGLRVTRYAMVSALAAALVLLFCLIVLLQRIVIRPLTHLTSHAVAIGRTDDTTARLGIDRDDELGQLAVEFDGMIEKLARSRAQVVETARYAGMSEIATGVLHNVGNVLNSVNVSASLVHRGVDRLPLADLEKLVSVLGKNADDLTRFLTEDRRGKHTLPFLKELSATLSTQREELGSELRSLSRGIDHVADLVRAQQNYAGTKGVFEITEVAEQVDSALAICRQAFGAEDKIEVVRAFEKVPPARIDRHKFMEIVVNLVQNARQAVLDSERDEKRIVVRLIEQEGKVLVQVEDNGVGVPTGNLKRIFSHGFTTKKDGHGFGLHVSANAAKEMGASLRGDSEGPGHGACFTLEIPLEVQEAANAA